MAGKMRTSETTNSKEDFRLVKAYAEGVEARIASAAPVNPHPASTPEYDAWALGMNDITTGAASVDPCVAVGGRSAAS